jgi:hypothetical protein
MRKIEINNEYRLGIESDGKGARLTLYKSGQSYVCRKVNKKEAQAIIESNNKVFFSGRLKLHKRDSKIEIEAKNEFVGSIPFKSIQAELDIIFEGKIA